MLPNAARSELAVYVLLVDAKDDTAAAFYRHHGFMPLEGKASDCSCHWSGSCGRQTYRTIECAQLFDIAMARPAPAGISDSSNSYLRRNSKLRAYCFEYLSHISTKTEALSLRIIKIQLAQALACSQMLGINYPEVVVFRKKIPVHDDERVREAIAMIGNRLDRSLQ